jgi:hypothetical protein
VLRSLFSPDPFSFVCFCHPVTVLALLLNFVAEVSIVWPLCHGLRLAAQARRCSVISASALSHAPASQFAPGLMPEFFFLRLLRRMLCADLTGSASLLIGLIFPAHALCFGLIKQCQSLCIFCLRSPAVPSDSSHRECCQAKAFSACPGLGPTTKGLVFAAQAAFTGRVCVLAQLPICTFGLVLLDLISSQVKFLSGSNRSSTVISRTRSPGIRRNVCEDIN